MTLFYYFYHISDIAAYLHTLLACSFCSLQQCLPISSTSKITFWINSKFFPVCIKSCFITNCNIICTRYKSHLDEEFAAKDIKVNSLPHKKNDERLKILPYFIVKTLPSPLENYKQTKSVLNRMAVSKYIVKYAVLKYGLIYRILK